MKRKRKKNVWCIRHRGGWCATKIDRSPDELAASVKTACGFVVILPWGTKRRRPTCLACISLTG